MPIYEYRCRACDNVFEEWQKGFEERNPGCPSCGASSDRLISHTSFVLKGAGWYVTDYCGKKPSGTSEESATKTDSAPNATETKDVSSAPAAKPACAKSGSCASSPSPA